MKRVLTAITLLISQLSFAQVTVSWFNFPGGVAVARDAINNVYTANWDYNPAGDITLTKRDALGNIIWEVPYNNTDLNTHEVATWVATDNAGDIIVSGTIRSGFSNPVNAASVLMKYNASGSLLWRVVYESSFDGSSTRKCLVDASNNIYVLGMGTGPNGQVTKVKKFNSAGATVWNYFDAGGGAPMNFKLTPDNSILLIKRGITASINSFSKIDLNGTLIWNLPGISSIGMGDAAGDAFGNTYIINGESLIPGVRSVLKKLSTSAAVAWVQSISFNGNKVEVGNDHNPIVSGYPAAGYGTAFIKHDANGNMLWQNLDGDGAAVSLLAHAELKLDATNAAYVAGSTMSEMGICKVNNDGITAWTGLTSTGYPTNFIFGSDNSIFVTGGTTARFIQGAVATVAAPTNLTATANGTVLNLNWVDNASDETGYTVQRSLSASSNFVTIATLAANSIAYPNTGLPNSTTYYYRVQAVRSNTVSAWSNTANATTVALPPSIPVAPTNLTATANGTSINLAWTDNAINETTYIVQRSLSASTNFITIATLAANSITYINAGLPNSTTYYFRVQAANTNGVSAWTNTANATTVALPPTIPVAPTNLSTLSAGCNQVHLEWKDNSNNETEFEISRATSLNGPYTTIATLSANTTTYNNGGLRTNRRYYYRVRCKNTAGASSWSNKANTVVTCNTAAKVSPHAQQVLVFPNPAVNEINVQVPNTFTLPLTVDIISASGQTVYSRQISSYLTKIPTDKLPKGMYVVQLHNGDIVEAIKVVIN